MPRASTSARTLDSPGFRKSTPRRAAAQRASTNIASTSAQLLQTAIDLNGKGEARAPNRDEEPPFTPPTESSRTRTRGERKRGTDDKHETASKRRKVVDDRSADVPNTAVTTAESLNIAKGRATNPHGPEALARPARKKRTKHVRIAQTVAATTSDGETSAYQPSEATDSDDSDADAAGPIGLALANSGAATALSPDEEVDWADPLSIPSAQPVRSRRYWQWLELGIYTSALHDVARDEAHLGQALVEWELLRKHRAAEEALARAAQVENNGDDKETQDGPSRASSAAVGTPAGSRVATPEPNQDRSEEDNNDDDATPRPPRTKRPRKRVPASHDPNRSLTPFPVTRAATAQLEVDEDGVSLLPLPSAVALAKMARWPVHSSLVPSPDEERNMQGDVLEEALLAQYERVARGRDPATLPAPSRQTRAPSAYAVGGPFEHPRGVDTEDSDGSDTSEPEAQAEDDDDDLLLEPESLPPSMTSIPPLFDSILLRLLDLVPKAPMPAYDYWMQKTRTDELLKDDKRQGFVRDECAPGWEEVLAVVKEMDVPKQ
ncbi:hypothetical protein JCM3774_002256 [Rhodotorula dairenensis]